MEQNEMKARRIVLIDRVFQFRMIVGFIVINALVTAIFGFLIYIFFDSEIAANLASAHAAYRNVSEMLLPIVITLSAFSLMVSSIIISFVVLYSSHRIAGPLYRFKLVLDAIANRNLDTVTRIREKDQFQKLSIAFSRMVETISGDLELLEDKIADMRAILWKAHDHDHQEVIQALQVKAAQLEKILADYNFRRQDGKTGKFRLSTTITPV